MGEMGVAGDGGTGEGDDPMGVAASEGAEGWLDGREGHDAAAGGVRGIAGLFGACAWAAIFAPLPGDSAWANSTIEGKRSAGRSASAR